MIYTRDIIGDQWVIFSKSLQLGLLLGGCYDFLRVLRTLIHFGKKLYITLDFLFCVFAGFIIFSFLLNENFGIPRFYILFGISLGFAFWYFTIGRISKAFAKFLRKVIKAVLRPFIKIFQKIIKFIKKRLIKAKIIPSKCLNKPKSLLKKKAKMVYNILCLNISKAFLKKAGKEPEKVESNGTEKTEEETFSENSSYCLRGLSSLFSDFNAGRNK